MVSSNKWVKYPPGRRSEFKTIMSDLKLITPETQPDVVPVRDPAFLLGKPTYEVRTRWEYEWRGLSIVALPGYQFDGASVPRLFWALTGYTPYGVHVAAALAHDIACDLEGCLRNGKLLGSPVAPKRGEVSAFAVISSVDAAELFYDLMLASGVRRSKALIMWLAVRWFGPRWKTEIES